jgi:Tol biopolymer transport system component
LLVTDVDSRISFSPDSRRFAFRRDSTLRKTSAILIVDADGSHEQTVAELSFPANFGGNPSWSPDGKIIAIMDYFGQKTGELGQFVALDAATGRRTQIAPFSRVGWILGSSWLPDGSGLLVASNGPVTNWTTQIAVVSYPAGEFRRVTNDLNRYAAAISTTRDGSSLVTVANENSNNIWVMPASGTTAQVAQISSGRAEAANLDWTADGRILSYASQRFEFNLRMTDGSGKITILADSLPAFQPSVCGDGRYIVFTGVRSQNGETVWRMDSSGGNLKELTSGPANQNPICSPDGQWVAYESLNDNGNIWKVPIDGGTPTRLGPLTGSSPAISSDGKMIAFTSLEGTVPNIRNLWIVVPSNGGAPLYTLIADVRAAAGVRAARGLRFTPDGKSLAYIVDERGVSNLWAMPLTGGAPKQLTNFKSDLIFDYAWSRDGKHLAISRGQVNHDVVLLTDTTQ